MSDYRFETLQLHVGQTPQPIQERFRSTRQHHMYSTTASTLQTVSVLQTPETSTEDLPIPHRTFSKRE